VPIQVGARRPRRTVALQAAAVTAIAAVSFFAGLRMKREASNGPSQGAPLPAATVDTLRPLDVPPPEIAPAPTLETPPPAAASAMRISCRACTPMRTDHAPRPTN
jgi:hypothetical protein